MITLVSNSSLKTLSECETAFVLQYVLGYSSEKESAMAVAGQAAHEAWAEYFRGRPPKAALALFQALYEPFTDDLENYIEERMTIENTYAALDVWFARNPKSKLPFIVDDPDNVEIKIEEPLDENGDFRYVAILDLLAKTREDSSWVVVDHKSTRAMTEWWEKKFVNGAQMTSYVWAARRYLKDDTINRAFINGLVFKRLNRTFTKCTMSGHGKRADCWPEHVEYKVFGPYERTQEQIKDWHQTALTYAKKFPEYYDKFSGKVTQEKIDSLNVNGALHDQCRFCQFQTFCSFGRKVHRLETSFQKKERPNFGEGRTGVWDEDEQ